MFAEFRRNRVPQVRHNRFYFCVNGANTARALSSFFLAPLGGMRWVFLDVVLDKFN